MFRHAWTLLATLATVCLLAPGTHGILLVSKTLTGPQGHLRLVRDANATVLITLRNAGQGTLVNATLHDQTFNNGSAWRLVAGRNYQKVPDLAPGASHSVQFTVVPRVKGTVRSFPAVVKYATSEGGKFTAFSNFKAVYVQPFSRAQSALVCALLSLCMYLEGSTD
jgi:hypothetical protein